MSDFFQDDRIAAQIQAIRKFCETPAHQSGGILLLSGPRGSGKTRLVDYALNAGKTAGSAKNNHPNRARSIIYKLWAILFGEDRRRRRLITLRQPRTTNRILLPVAVDPFFPHEPPTTSSDQTASRINRDTQSEAGTCNQDVIRLLKNILFGLTSTIDTRLSIRCCGRTLHAALGWVRTWLSPTACYMPGVSHHLWTRALKGIAIVVLPCVAYYLAQPLITVLLDYMSTTHTIHMTPLTPSWIQCVIIATFSWLYLRWRDLRGIGRMGQRLYDLVHAQSFAQNQQLQFERHLQWQMNGRNLLQVASLLLITGGVGIAFAGSGLVFSTPLILLLLGSSWFFWSHHLTKQVHTTFGDGNRVWMITLLRRYIFLLHRCGLEPVLVLDELDKLSVDKDLRELSLNDPPGPDVIRLLHILSNLKQSLGTYFLWILIDTHHLYNILIRQRTGSAITASGWQGPVATLIHTELLVRPLSFAELTGYLDQQHSTMDQYQRASFWLETRGLFSRIVNPSSMSDIRPESGGRALFLAHRTQEVTDQIQKTNTDSDSLWLQTGLIDFAYYLLHHDKPDDDLYLQQNDDNPATSPSMSDPYGMLWRGREELRVYLERLYRSCKSGIDPEGGVLHVPENYGRTTH